jgi:hypothetical protein
MIQPMERPSGRNQGSAEMQDTANENKCLLSSDPANEKSRLAVLSHTQPVRIHVSCHHMIQPMKRSLQVRYCTATQTKCH